MGNRICRAWNQISFFGKNKKRLCIIRRNRVIQSLFNGSFTHERSDFAELKMGLEPTTPSLRVKCSTNWAIPANYCKSHSTRFFTKMQAVFSKVWAEVKFDNGSALCHYKREKAVPVLVWESQNRDILLKNQKKRKRYEEEITCCYLWDDPYSYMSFGMWGEGVGW